MALPTPTQMINGLMMKSTYDGADGPITLQYNRYEGDSKVGGQRQAGKRQRRRDGDRGGEDGEG